MIRSTGMFIDALENWLKAVQADDFASAKAHAEYLHKSGELLLIHPDFHHCFSRHFPDIEISTALQHMCQFLICTTEGRARARKHSG